MSVHIFNPQGAQKRRLFPVLLTVFRERMRPTRYYQHIEAALDALQQALSNGQQQQGEQARASEAAVRTLLSAVC